jgi:hypothetical protein
MKKPAPRRLFCARPCCQKKLKKGQIIFRITWPVHENHLTLFLGFVAVQ